MKRMLVSLALLSALTAARADTWVMPNQGNGEITLTDQTCKADGGKYTALKHAYSWTTNIYFEGCWLVQDGNIHVIWVHNDGTRERRVYPPSAFTKKGASSGYKY